MTLGLVATPAAAAGGAAYNQVTEYLTAAPNHYMRQTCQNRSIYLEAGWYFWEQTQTSEHRNIYLGVGYYSWDVCLTPRDGYYDETSTLTPPTGATAKLYYAWDPNNSGTITWGDELDPPGCC